MRRSVANKGQFLKFEEGVPSRLVVQKDELVSLLKLS
jgi:hypothetical protein